MAGYKFSWDTAKNQANIKKHGIDFNDAQTAFYDENAMILADEEHSEDEERFILIGIDFNARLLNVCHCYRNGDSVVRIISARKANKQEIRIYGDNL